MEPIVLPRMAIEITTRCNLRCKFCSVGIPTQREAVHLSLETVREYLKALFEVVDYTRSLEFTGGEPLLHEDLPEMIRAYMAYEKRFGQFLIVTNGTVPAGDALLDVLREYRARGVMHISDYGLAPARTAALAARLDEIGFPYRIDKYYGEDQYQGGWVDPGAVAPRGRPEEALREVYARCGLVVNGGCWRVHLGQLHVCARSCRCADAGYVFPGDFLDFMDSSVPVGEKREKLRALMNAPYLKACDYCNGTMGTKDPAKRIPAGEQAG